MGLRNGLDSERGLWRGNMAHNIATALGLVRGIQNRQRIGMNIVLKLQKSRFKGTPTLRKSLSR